MPGIDEVQEFLTAILVILFISLFITIAWMSTYVRDHPVVAAAVVVFQQQSAVSEESFHENLNQQPRIQTDSPISSDPAEIEAIMDASTDNNESILDCNNPHSNVNNSHSDTFKASSAHVEEIMFETLSTALDENLQEPCNHQAAVQEHCNHQSAGQEHSNHQTAVQEPCNHQAAGPSLISEVISNNKICANNVKDELKENCNEVSVVEAEAPIRLPMNEDVTSQIDDIPGTIRIKLRFLDDTQRLVRGHLSDKVKDFKIANFELELSTNCAVRLIFNGQLLNREASTLGQYGLFDNCVVHCHVSQSQSASVSNEISNLRNQESDGFDLSELLNPLLLSIVAFLWYLRYEYSHIFNTSATVILICLTALLLISQCALTVSFNVSLGYNNNGNNGDNGTTTRRESNTSAIPDLSLNLQETIERVHEEPPDGNVNDINSTTASIVVDPQDLEDNIITRRNTPQSTAYAFDPISSI